MELKRRIAIFLVLSMIMTSTQFDAVNVFASEMSILDEDSDQLETADKEEFNSDINENVIADTEVLEEDNIEAVLDADVSDNKPSNTLLNNDENYTSVNTESTKEWPSYDNDLNGAYVIVTLSNNDGLYKSEDGLCFDIDNRSEKATLKKWTGSGNAVIPAKIKIEEGSLPPGKIDDTGIRTVVAIGEDAFKESGEHKLTGVEIPANLSEVDITIGDRAFANCTKLVSITIPDSVTAMGDNVFDGCTNLEDVKLSERLNKLGQYIFNNCNSLEHLEIPNCLDFSATVKENALSGAKNLKEFTFGKNTKKLADNLFSGCTALERIDLPLELTNIGIKTFYNCKKLETVTMPENVSGIGRSAFEGCLALKEFGVAEKGKNSTESENVIRIVSENTLQIPKCIEIIDERAFYGCQAITKLWIPKSIKEIRLSAYENCIGITELTFIPGDTSMDISMGRSIGKYAFKGCGRIEDLFIPQVFSSIGESAFENCIGIKEVVFENIYSNLTGGIIGKNAFLKCTGIKNAIISENYKTIGESAFQECTGLEEVTFLSENKNPVKSTIDTKAFYKCSNLKKATIAENYEKIGTSAFEDCTTLEEVVFLDETENSIKNGIVGQKAFYNCQNLKVANLSKHYSEIWDYAFGGCKKLGKDGNTVIPVIIPDSIKLIAPCAFINCESIANLTLSRNLEKIGSAAFKNCISLSTLKIPKSIKTVVTRFPLDYWEENYKIDTFGGVFNGCILLKNIYFEEDTVSIADNLFNDADYLEYIDIPNTVTNIGNASFKKCVSLKKITYIEPTKVTKIGNEAFSGCLVLNNRIEGNKAYSVMPDSLINLGNSAFENCNLLTIAKIPSGTETLGQAAFKGCKLLNEAYIPDTVNSIGVSCFENCSKMVKVTLPKEIETIPSSMFKNCELLSDNTLPVSIKSIGGHAFESCKSITILDFREHKALSKIDEYAFANCKKLTTLKLSDSTNVLGKYAFNYCDELVNIDLGTGLKTVPEQGFSDLGKLKSITIPRNVTFIDVKAFWNDPSLSEAHIAKETRMVSPVFSSHDKVTLVGVKGSPAEQYAKNHEGMKFREETVPVKSIKFSTESIKLEKNKTVKILEDIKVEIQPVNYTEDINYTSSDDSILTVDKNLTVKGITKGTAKVKAIVSGNSTVSASELTVRVMEGVERVELNKTTDKMYPGDTVQLEATVIPYDAIDTSVTWSVDKPDLATVDSTGFVTVHKVGTVNVTVTSNNGNKTKTCVITVENEPKLEETPCSLSADTINVPVANIVSGSTLMKGTVVRLTCDAPGASIYYTTNGRIPRADHKGNLGSYTQLYKGGIVVNDDITIKAFAIREGYHNSEVATFIYAIDKWGDIEDGLHEKFDGRKIPSGIWYCFDGDDTIYEKSDKVIQTKIVKESTGLNQNFSNEIHVYYGNRKLYEKRDYTVSYKNSKKPAKASDEKAPTFTIKGTGTYSGTSTFAYTIEGDAKVVSSKGIKVACLNKSPIYTGNPLTLADLYKTDNKHNKITLYKGSTDLVEGTDYDIDTTDFATSGTFNVLFKLKGNYSGYIAQKVTVKPYDIKKDTSNKIRIEFAKDNGTTPYSQAGATPAVSVWFGNERLTEGVDYTLSYKSNKKVSSTAKVVVKGKGMFKGSRDTTFSVVQKPVGEGMELYLKDVVETASAGKFMSKPVVWDNGVKVKTSYIAKYDVSDCTFYDVTNGKTLTKSDTPKANTLIKVTLKVKSSNNKSPYIGEGNVIGYFKIIEKNKDISKATVTLTNDRKSLPFNDGNEVVPLSEMDLVVNLKYAEQKDAEPKDHILTSKDYEIVSITKNKIIGTATVTLRGKGQYGGTMTYKLKIAKKTF